MYHASAAVEIGNVSQVTALFTDGLPGMELQNLLKASHVEVLKVYARSPEQTDSVLPSNDEYDKYLYVKNQMLLICRNASCLREGEMLPLPARCRSQLPRHSTFWPLQS